jgi:hypothetical protein
MDRALILLAAALPTIAGCGISQGSYLRIGGAARPEYAPSPLPLREKAARFEDLMKAHISAEGVNVYIIHGDDKTADQEMETVTLSDCAIWTGVLLGAQCMRLAATADPAARDEARRLLGGLRALTEVTGVPGYYARCLARRAEPWSREGGTWHPGAGKWAGYRWKGDTSKDQYSGVIFGLGLAATLAVDAEIKAGARDQLGWLADFLLKNDLQIVELDGARTTYGDLSGYIAGVPIGVNAAIALAALKTAAAATGERRFSEAYDRLVNAGYARATVMAKFQVFGKSNGSNDVMAFLSLFNLLRLEEDPEVRRSYVKSCERFRDYVRFDGNSFFNFIISFAVGGDRALLDDARLTLALFPLEKRNFTTDSSGRKDIQRSFWKGRRGAAQALYPLPINYRSQSTWVWRDNPRQVTNLQFIEGNERAAPTDYLAAYWLGRYLGSIAPEE